MHRPTVISPPSLLRNAVQGYYGESAFQFHLANKPTPLKKISLLDSTKRNANSPANAPKLEGGMSKFIPISGGTPNFLSYRDYSEKEKPDIIDNLSPSPNFANDHIR